MAIKSLYILAAEFSSGQVDNLLASSGDGIRMRIYPTRQGKIIDMVVKDTSSLKKVILPIKIESKLRRLIKDYDKLGKKSVDL